ncbi:MAG: MarR family transcriptional regulator [Anaerolineaceae bacterium]|nr:MarR family transcriptional regulator [Anaerolineaceae bacterium]
MDNFILFPTAIEIQIYNSLLLKFFNQPLEERLAKHGVRISSLQYGILRMLQGETLTISVLSQRLGIDPSTLVRSVDGLERLELARRGRDPHDRRRNPIQITDKGLLLLTDIPPITPQDQTFQALQSLGIDKALQLKDLLSQLIKEFPEGKLVADLMEQQNKPPDY